MKQQVISRFTKVFSVFCKLSQVKIHHEKLPKQKKPLKKLTS